MSNPDSKPRPLLLEMRQIRKAFPGVLAVSDGRLELREGEILALVGENGAGKSTLVKILMGVHRPDAGEIRLAGERIEFRSPIEAFRHGMAIIYQEFSLIPSLPVRDNLFLGHEKSRHGILNKKFETAAAKSVFKRLGINLNLNTPVRDLTIAEQQMVEIGRALLFEARVIIMDEPTAALSPREVQSLFTILRELAGRGIGIVFVSHRLEEVFAIADRVTVMRDGCTIDTREISKIDRSRLIEMMVGRPMQDEYPRSVRKTGEVCLEVREFCGRKLSHISFAVRRGEILSLVGLMGAGRTDVARLIFGADPKEGGELFLNGQVVEVKSPRDAINSGICLLTENRKEQGLILKLSVKENYSLPHLSRWSKKGWIDQGEEISRFYSAVKDLNIRLTGPNQKAVSLSGGNQQKLLVARWLETDAQVIIFDEPTRGIDVGAKYEMYLLMNRLAESGKAIIVISSDLPEALGISDRILVMKEGKIAGEIKDVSRASQEDIMALAV